MERLTRTKKYADLRNRISQDQESSLSTDDLNKYEDKLKRLEAFFANNGVETEDNSFLEDNKETEELVLETEPTINKEDSFKPLSDVLEETIIPVIEETVEVEEVGVVEKIEETVEEVKEEVIINKDTRPLDEVLTDEVNMMSRIVEAVSPTKVVVEEEIINKDTRPLDEVLTDEVNTLSQIVENVSPTNTVVEKEEVEEVEEVIINKDTRPLDEVLTDEVNMMSRIVEAVSPTKVVVEEEEPEEEIIEVPEKLEENIVEVQEEPKSIKIPLEDTFPEINSIDEPKEEKPTSYVDEIFSDVETYNKENNQKSVEELSNEIIDEVRHPEGAFNKVSIGFEEDKDFSDTVSLEIDKVLSEINSEPIVTVDNDNLISDVEIADIDELEKTAEIALNTAEVQAAELVQEEKTSEPIVIKNISEMKNENVLEDTIPFVIDNEEDDEDEDDENLDGNVGTSKALNVILGILIFVLIAVLAVIIYFIVKLQG